MKLILQSLTANTKSLRQIAAPVNSQQIVELSPHSICCRNLTFSDGFSHIQEKVNQLAYQNQVDTYWTESEKKLTDFKLLVMDMDSTLITIECIDEIADMQGLKPQVAEITEAAMRG